MVSFDISPMLCRLGEYSLLLSFLSPRKTRGSGLLSVAASVIFLMAGWQDDGRYKAGKAVCSMRLPISCLFSVYWSALFRWGNSRVGGYQLCFPVTCSLPLQLFTPYQYNHGNHLKRWMQGGPASWPHLLSSFSFLLSCFFQIGLGLHFAALPCSVALQPVIMDGCFCLSFVFVQKRTGQPLNGNAAYLPFCCHSGLNLKSFHLINVIGSILLQIKMVLSNLHSCATECLKR